MKVCEIMYALDTQRSPWSVLQLYNLTWLNHELCKSLFVKFLEVTHDKLFGLYLRSIVIHAPLQYDVLCLRSVNTENQERIFSRLKLLPFQPQTKTRECCTECNATSPSKASKWKFVIIIHSDNGVKISSRDLPPHRRTEIQLGLLQSKLHSWQAHL